MILFMFAVVVLAAYQCEINIQGHHSDYISKDATQPIKGIFILWVFVSHCSEYCKSPGVWDTPFFAFRNYFWQCMVAPFLFYSGYGIAESIRLRGKAYVKRMPAHRLAGVYFPFCAAVLLFLFFRYASGKTYSLKHILLSFAAWESVGNSHWYVFAILCMYAITWFSYTLFRKSDSIYPPLLTTALSLGYIVIMRLYTDKLPVWYETIFPYLGGVWYARWRTHFEKNVLSNRNFYAVCLSVCIVIFLYLRPFMRKILVYNFISLLFAVIVVMLSAKIKINSKFLSYCGKHLFSLFILQRLPMLMLQKTLLPHGFHLFFIACFALTLAMSYIFDKTVGAVRWGDMIDKLFTRSAAPKPRRLSHETKQK